MALAVVAMGLPVQAAEPVWTTLDEQGYESYKVRLTIAADAGWPGQGTVRVLLDGAGDGPTDGYLITVDLAEATLERLTDGARTRLAESDGWIPGAELPLNLTIARDRHRIQIIANGRVRLMAEDATWPIGRIAVATDHAGLNIGEPELQPTEEIWFADDFMRVEEETGAWAVRSGAWQASGVSDENARGNKRPEARLSANPFAYRAAVPTGTALATAGYWFWDSYRFETAFRAVAADGPAAIGLCLYLQDPEHYLAFRWSHAGSGPGGQEQRLVAVADGVATTLAAAPGGWADDQWYRLSFSVLDGVLLAAIDDQIVLRARTDRFGQGQIGLWSEAVTFADFDDVAVESLRGLRETFAERVSGRWDIAYGDWTLDQPAQRRDEPANHNAWTLRRDYGLCITGLPDWTGYRVETLARAPRGGLIGVVAAWQDERNHLQFRWGDRAAPPGLQERLQLVQVVDGVTHILAESRASFQPGAWHVLALENRHGYFVASVDGRSVFETYQPDQQTGRAGILGYGSGIAFDDVDVAFLPPPPRLDFTDQFTREDTMAGWATAAGQFEPVADNGVYWYRGDLHGDGDVAISPALFGGPKRTVLLTLAADGQDPRTGYSLAVQQVNDNSTEVILRLFIRGEAGQHPSRQATVDLRGANSLRLSRHGGFVLGLIDEDYAVGAFEPFEARPRGVRAGVFGLTNASELEQVQVRGDNVLDTSFTSAPVEWFAGKGVWATTNRWKCDPRWSFFGGHMDDAPYTAARNPVLWSKDDYGGDVRFEAYLAIQMDLEQAPHYSHPSDLGLVIGGDGRNPQSGTMLLFAAHDNTCSVLTHRGRELARSTEPQARFKHTGPQGQGLTEFHRHWFHLVLRRSQGRLVATVDDQPLFDVPDPEPSAGGKVGLFTVHNGLMVARARVCYQQRLPRQLFADVDAQLAAADRGADGGDPYDVDFERGLGEFRAVEPRARLLVTRSADQPAAGRHCLQVTNLEPGGRMAVDAVTTAYPLVERPKLTFDLRLSPDARLHAYVRVRDVWHRLLLRGGESLRPGQRDLGSIGGVPGDDRWHSVEVDLATAFEKLYPGQALTVQAIRFAQDEPDGYLLAGFAGNGFGTSWWVDEFRVGQ